MILKHSGGDYLEYQYAMLTGGLRHRLFTDVLVEWSKFKYEFRTYENI